MSLTQTAIRRPIATAMIYLIVITVGILGFYYLSVDLLPPIEYPRLTVHVSYPNVGPEEMEKIITEPIENAVAGVPNVEKMTSRSDEGRSYVSLSFAQGTNLDEAANDVRAALDRVRDDLPLEAEAPGIWKFDPNNSPIVILGVSSKTKNLEQLTQIIDRDLRNRFEQIPGVGTIDIWGGVNRQINVFLKRDRLMAGDLTSRDVTQAIARENSTLPAGNVKSGISDLYMRSLGEYKSLDQIRNTVITNVNGDPIRIGDVANVVDGYADLGRYVQVDGQPMIRVAIRKQSGANTVDVARQVKNEVKRINQDRNDLSILAVSDQSTFIKNSISNVLSSAMWGGLLAIFILYLFLRNGSSTFIIALSIPISIIATFALLYLNGMTLNLMSLGGLALGVGMMVDNSIVVIENIVHIRHTGKDLKESADIGTKQVAGAIISSTLTTIVIFLPVVFMQSVSGMLFQELALVIVFSLLCSLLVALTLVPMLSSRFMDVQEGHKHQIAAKSKIARFLNKMEDKYADVLGKAISKRGLVFGICAVAVIATALLFRDIPVELAPKTDADEIEVQLEMAQGTNIAVVNQFTKELDGYVKSIIPKDQVEHISRDVRNGNTDITLTLVDAKKRTISPTKLADEIRSKVEGLIPGATIRVQAQPGLWILRRIFSSGDSNSAIEIELRGNDLKKAQELSLALKQKIEAVPGVTDVQVGDREGRPQQDIIFNREKIAQLGLSVQDVSRILETNVGGTQAGQYREGGDQYPIMVRLAPDDRLTSQDLDNISIKASDGRILPISAVVNKVDTRGPTSINHIDGLRVTYITAGLKGGVALGDGVNRIRSSISGINLPKGFSIVFGGEYEEQQKAAADFRMSIIIAIILVYMVMAGQFERFIDPLIVMFSVPLAIVGVVPVMMLTGTTLNMQSLMGIVMLAGIVVNNAIVLVDYINLMIREEGLPVYQAVIEAGRLRLRPILMTMLTTVLGLLPMSFGWGAGGAIQASLARVVIGGLIASTLITLILIPVIYINVAKLREKAKGINFSPIQLLKARFGTN
ncbi:MAG TPA: efflux RND transporter permease subunit [Balneolales bacterium]|nr:efflux RND transporter permease subunit [Balneolales bacterium]